MDLDKGSIPQASYMYTLLQREFVVAIETTPRLGRMVILQELQKDTT